jgi:hypothetical protein
MLSARNGTVLIIAASAVLCTAWYNPVQAPDEANLRKKALSLNNVTGKDPIKGEIQALVDDPAGTRQLLAVATKMAGEKPQPFNYNGAFILAQAALRLKELDASFALHRVCFESASRLRSNEKILPAYEGLDLTIQLYFREKKYDQALKASKALLETEEKQASSDLLKADTHRLVIEALVRAGKGDEARKLVDNLLKVRRTWRNLEIKVILERSLKNYAAAIKTYEEMAPLLAKDEEMPAESKTEGEAKIKLEVAKLYFLDKKYAQAAKAAQELVTALDKQGVADESVGREQALRLWLDSLIKIGKLGDARQAVDELIKKHRTWRSLELKAQVERELKNYPAAVQAYEDTLPLFANDDTLTAEQRQALQTATKLEVAKLYLEDKKYDKCVKAAEDLLESLTKQQATTNAKSAVLRLEVRALVLAGKVKEADKVIDKLGSSPDSSDYLFNLELKALVEREKGNDEAAARIYQDLLAYVKKTDKLGEEEREAYEHDVRYLLSSVYIDLDQVNKAVAELEYLLKKEPNNATYNNDLGYILADHDMKLPEAEKMIRRALDLDRKDRKTKGNELTPGEDKDNAAYLDSLGWVLFKLKNYPEAKKYLLDAVKEKDGQHIEIMDHLADVYMALGEKAEAVKIWQKALTLETKSKREKERKVQVEKKLKANQ